MRAALMIHGYACTGEVWARFRPAFEAAGYRVEAPTLFAAERVADAPPGVLGTRRLMEYVAEAEGWVANLARETGTPPVVVGHSMGGLITQKLAERAELAAAVLLTPASPVGAGAFALAPIWIFRDALFTPFWWRRPVKSKFDAFSWGVLNRVPPARHHAIFAGLVYDSGRVLAELTRPDTAAEGAARVDPGRITAPILTVGGARDRTTAIAAVRRVGQLYGAHGGDYLEYPDNAHWLIDEPGTDRIIADVIAWLARRTGG